MAEMAQESQLVALDTNFLIDLADGNESCWDCLEALRQVRKPPALVATLTVLQELAHLVAEGDTSEKRHLAEKALHSLVEWGIHPLNFIPAGNGIIERIGDEIRRIGLLPDEERNDSFIVAEAALANCALLISSDIQISGIDRGGLRALLVSFDVEATAILPPREVARMFRKR